MEAQTTMMAITLSLSWDVSSNLVGVHKQDSNIKYTWILFGCDVYGATRD